MKKNTKTNTNAKIHMKLRKKHKTKHKKHMKLRKTKLNTMLFKQTSYKTLTGSIRDTTTLFFTNGSLKYGNESGSALFINNGISEQRDSNEWHHAVR